MDETVPIRGSLARSELTCRCREPARHIADPDHSTLQMPGVPRGIRHGERVRLRHDGTRFFHADVLFLNASATPGCTRTPELHSKRARLRKIRTVIQEIVDERPPGWRRACELEQRQQPG